MIIPIYYDDYNHDAKLPEGAECDPERYTLTLTNQEYLKLIDALHMPGTEEMHSILNQLAIFKDNCKNVREMHKYKALYGILQTMCTEINRIRSGYTGEDTVYKRLTDNGEDWVVLHDINLPYWNSSTEIDSIVFANGNIFVIEVKNYHYKAITFSKDGSVSGLDYNDDQNPDKNLLTQVEDHELAVRKCLVAHSGLSVDELRGCIHSMIIIANDTSDNEIINETDLPVVKLVFARRTISNLSENRVLSKKSEEIAIQTIKKCKMPDKKFTFIDPIIYKQRLSDFLHLLPQFNQYLTYGNKKFDENV